MTNLRLILFVLPLAGCAAAMNLRPLTAAHPASPEAKEAPLTQASETLSLPSTEPGSTDGSSEPASDGMEGRGIHAGHHMDGTAEHGDGHAH